MYISVSDLCTCVCTGIYLYILLSIMYISIYMHTCFCSHANIKNIVYMCRHICLGNQMIYKNPET